MEKEVTIRYEGGHSYDFTYVKNDIYCPSCGKQSVWNEQGQGDFYEGPPHVCLNCKAEFTLPSLSDGDGVNKIEQLVKQLREET